MRQKKIISTYGLNLVVEGSEFNPDVNLNYIIRQDPQPGKKILKNSTVEVIISKGIETVLITVPNLISLTREEAIKLLRIRV